jgi:multidrug resistance efflux pump
MTHLHKNKRWLTGLAAAVLLPGVAIPVLLLSGQQRSQPTIASKVTAVEPVKREEPDDPDPPGIVTVKTVRPKRGPSLEVTVEQPAYVEAYYRAELHARVAGPVKYIEKANGDPVASGERLVEIDVPDLVQDVAQKQSVVEQRKCDLQVAEAMVRCAQAATTAAEKSVQQSESRVAAAEEEQEFRRKEYNRFKQLATGTSPAVTPDIVDERLKWYNVAKANKITAEIAVLKAKADLEEAKQKIEGALADVNLKKSLIRVAEEDRNRAQAMLDLATIRAPFDGVVARRNVDPGSFVHNAATANRAEPLLTVERTDIVTVYMKVPDKYAPYVSKDTEAVIEMTDLPGELIRGKVTRFIPSLQTPEHDRTMRVEVDLYNGSQEEYQKFLEREKATGQADLKGRVLPILPAMMSSEEGAPSQKLLPGMYGKMRLVLRKFQDVHLLPSQAVVRHGGTPYIYQVIDGVAHRVPVLVEMDDGKLARLRTLSTEGDKQIRHKLTGQEEIVTSNQGELSDGQAVEASHVDW